MEVTDLANYYEARDWIVEYLCRDLEGPHTNDEVLSDNPVDTYICGVLYPQNIPSGQTNLGSERQSETVTGIDPELHHDDDEGQEDIADLEDKAVSLSNSRYPSSIGMTFKISVDSSPVLKVQVNASRYHKLSDDIAEEGSDDSEKVWKRDELQIPVIYIDTSLAEENLEIQLSDGLVLRTVLRRPREGAQIITLSLVNVFMSGFEDRPQKSFFQSKITVTEKEGKEVFVATDTEKGSTADEDEESSNLLYRGKRTFAVGHGCSPTWEVHDAQKRDDESSYSAFQIETNNIPRFNLKLTDSNEDIESSALGMSYLARGPRAVVTAELKKFVQSYRTWVDSIAADLQHSVSQELVPTGQRHIDHMYKAISRMNSGIEQLVSDDQIWASFQLANKAMLTTRMRDQWIQSGRESAEPSFEHNHSWYPFQLAFLLLCLDGCANSKHEDRDYLDLLWFPTGGGKTEAYLVITAFVIFLRRLRNPQKGGGTSVLMRYSMRLLTVQQFERAAKLICSCEIMRLNDLTHNLGEEPITLGLFVGADGTPNRHKGEGGTITAMEALSDSGFVESGNPVQLQKCPWCGHEFNKSNIAQHYNVRNSGPNGEETLEINCGDPECEFSNSRPLPVYVVDQDLYLYKPTFVIATVDKFARLPYSPSSIGYAGNLFGGDSKNAPPDLIIQDELHLISGPLGSMTGIYETIIDAISETADGTRPKIIASTATIRNAKNQCKALFARESFQFPPPALDANSSYFARESSPENKGTRLYIGLFAPGTSQQTLLVRTYAALLQGAKELVLNPEIENSVKDAYWTLLGYFNTRLLMGTAGIQSRDDVPDRIKYLAGATGTEERDIDIQAEMWGGIDSGEMRDILDRLYKRFDDPESIDILFATNMISVGVDINRFGVQAMMGQPLSTAEYIQASSRVGRQYPGLVTVMYNSNKSRDRSYYESFTANHSTLYRQVESSSLTPFSPAARNRALHAVVVALTRFFFEQVRNTRDANDFLLISDRMEKITQIILKRIELIAPDEYEGSKKDIEEIFETWERVAEDVGEKLYYDVFNIPRASSDPWPLLCDPDNAENYARVIAEGKSKTREKPWETMSSLRNVDTNSSLFMFQDLD